jgi:RNase P/RNase MRP subunit p29
VTGQVTQGAKATVQIESETFTSVVSKRTIQRRFTLVGEVLDNGNSIKGDYVETITGFTPAPMVVKGKFLLTRPGDSQIVLPPRVGGTPPVTPISPKPDTPVTPVTPVTPKPGITPTSDGDSSLLLPYIKAEVPAQAAQATPVPGQNIYLPATKGE